MCVEPPLQALSGEHLTHDTANREDNARLDVKTRGFRGTSHQCAFFDVRVFDPNPESYHDFEMATCYRRHEGEKRHVYENRVREVEHGSFTPLVFSTSRGMGRAATVAYKRLATLIAAEREQPYRNVMGWLRCHLFLFPATLCCNVPQRIMLPTGFCTTRVHANGLGGTGRTHPHSTITVHFSKQVHPPNSLILLSSHSFLYICISCLLGYITTIKKNNIEGY